MTISRPVVVALAAVAIVIASCSSAAPPASPSQPAKVSLLAESLSSVYLLEWTRSTGQLAGSLRSAAIVDEDVATTTEVFTGLINGDEFTINFPPGSSLGSWSGSLVPSGARVQVTGPSGSIRTLDFANADAAAYNARLELLKGRKAEVAEAVADVRAEAAKLRAALATYESARADFAEYADYPWETWIVVMNTIQSSLGYGDIAGAKETYRDMKRDWASPFGPRAIYEDVEKNADLQMARARCSKLNPAGQQIHALVERVAGLSQQFGTTKPDMSADVAVAAAAASAYASCAGDLFADIEKLRTGYEKVKARYDRMLKDGRARGW